MKLTHIITLANKPVERYLRAMESSLRATGCTLPLYVIPYNDDRCELPDNAQWLDAPELFELLDRNNSHRMMRKYAALTRANFLFVDTDVIFLQNPERYYEPFDGFVANCTHWNNPGHTTSADSLKTFAAQSTAWPRHVFNAGQFASSQALFGDFAALKAACESQPQTTLTFPYHDQPGINYLAHYSKLPFTNITLPPHNFESSWAGDYLGLGEIPTTDRSPCFLHWAGMLITGNHPVDELFLKHIPDDQRQAFISGEFAKAPSFSFKLKNFMRGVKQLYKTSFHK